MGSFACALAACAHRRAAANAAKPVDQSHYAGFARRLWRPPTIQEPALQGHAGPVGCPVCTKEDVYQMFPVVGDFYRVVTA